MDNNFGIRLKKIRGALHLSQKELAEKTGINHITLCRYEAGKREPTLSFLSSLIHATNVSAKWLITGEGEMFNIENKIIDTANLPKERIKQWLDEFWKQADRNTKIWLEVEMSRKFPELAEWLKKINNDLSIDILHVGNFK